MSYISDKIAHVRSMGHVVPEGIEELFLAIEEEIGLDSKQKKDEPAEPGPNPFDGERLDT